MVAGNGYHWGSDWAEKLQDVPIPPVPTFDEAMSSVEERARRLVGKVRCGRKFEPAHPFVAKENRSSNGTESRSKLRTLMTSSSVSKGKTAESARRPATLI